MLCINHTLEIVGKSFIYLRDYFVKYNFENVGFDWLDRVSITVWETWKLVHAIIRHRMHHHERYGEFTL